MSGAMYDIKKCLSYLTLSENAYCVCACRLFFLLLRFFFQVIVGNQIQMAYRTKNVS